MGEWSKYDARKPRIRVSASGQCTGPYYTKDTIEYVLKADADRLAEALRRITPTIERSVGGDYLGGAVYHSDTEIAEARAAPSRL